MNKIRVIDLLNKITNAEELPKKIRINGYIYEYQGDDYLFIDKSNDNHEYWLFSEGYTDKFQWLDNFLRTEIEIIEEDKDIPLIPDDELYEIEYTNNSKHIDYNFKVLKEKINQVVEELNKRQ